MGYASLQCWNTALSLLKDVKNVRNMKDLHSIMKPWPFERWELYLIGEIKPTSSKCHRYVLVGIDYFIKWAEEMTLTDVDQGAVIDFIPSHIMCRYGNLGTITTDQGSVFVGRKVMEFASEKGIKFLTQTPTTHKLTAK